MKKATRHSLRSADRIDSKESLSAHSHHEHEYLLHDDFPRHHLNITASNPSGYDDSCHNSIPSPKADKSSPSHSTRKGCLRRDHRANRIMARMINKRTRCLMHGMTTSHSLFDCEQFNDLTYREKISFLLRKKRCIYCAGCHRSYIVSLECAVSPVVDYTPQSYMGTQSLPERNPLIYAKILTNLKLKKQNPYITRKKTLQQ